MANTRVNFNSRLGANSGDFSHTTQDAHIGSKCIMMPLAGCGRAESPGGVRQSYLVDTYLGLRLLARLRCCSRRRRPYPGLLFLLLASAASPRTRVVLSFMPATRRNSHTTSKHAIELTHHAFKLLKYAAKLLREQVFSLAMAAAAAAIHAAIRAGAEPTAAEEAATKWRSCKK